MQFRTNIAALLLLLVAGIHATAKDGYRPVIGLGYADVGFSKSHFNWRVYDQSSQRFSDTAYLHYNTSMIDWRVGGSLMGLAFRNKIKNWFVGDASEVSVAGGYGRAKEKKLNSTGLETDGTVALGLNIRWGLMAFYKIRKDQCVGLRYQWILQQEFLTFILSGDNINPHRKQLSLFGTYKNTTAEVSICTPYKLTMDATSGTRYNHTGYCLSLKQRLGRKFYCSFSAEKIHLRYDTEKTTVFNYKEKMQNEWWRGLATVGISI